MLGNKDSAYDILGKECPFKKSNTVHRTYTIKQKMEQFKKDGFIDRYTGEKMINPGMLKIFSFYFPDEFPYHAHWKMTETHIAYWELSPTIDHIYPIALGGKDTQDNWATTSMLNNSIKNSWTLDKLNWRLYPSGKFDEWDGLTRLFVEIVNKDADLLKDNYIKQWYNASKDVLQ